MKRPPTVSVRRTISDTVPSVPFERIALGILQKHYELSLVLCGDRLARKMNEAYRKKTYSPNVLSFPLGTREGEIFLNVRKAEREARLYGTTLRARLLLLFIHACYHLRGYGHGKKMEALEKRALAKFL